MFQDQVLPKLNLVSEIPVSLPPNLPWWFTPGMFLFMVVMLMLVLLIVWCARMYSSSSSSGGGSWSPKPWNEPRPQAPKYCKLCHHQWSCNGKCKGQNGRRGSPQYK